MGRIKRSTTRRGCLLRFLVVSLILMTSAAFQIYKEPVSFGIWLYRGILERSGFHRLKIEAPLGPMYCYEAGSGTTLVLLHGFGSESTRWAPAARLLKDDYHVVIPELPGHGSSAPTGGDLTYDDVYGGLVLALDQLATSEQIVLVGNSMGGWMSLIYTLAYPDRVERLVLVNSAGYQVEIDPEALLPATREGMQKKLAALLGPGLWLTPRVSAR